MRILKSIGTLGEKFYTTFNCFLKVICISSSFTIHYSIQGSSSLLSVSGGDRSADASWKVRLAEAKKAIEDASSNPPTTAAGPAPAVSQSQPQPQPQTAPAVASTIPAPASTAAVVPGTLVSKEAYNKLKRELEVKKDELKVALRKVEELSGNIKDTSLQSAKKVAARIKKNFLTNRANKPAADPNAPLEMTEVSVVELRALRKEIHDLEFVLNATEEKMEALTRESKVMKQILQQPQAYQMSNMNMNVNMMSPMISPERSGRRFGHIPQELVDGNIPSPAAILQHLLITSHRHLMDQVIFWRKLTLKRMFATLSELPRTAKYEQEVAKQAAEGALAAASTTITAMKSNHGMINTLSKLNLKSPKIEVVDKSFKNEYLDNKTLYRDLRRMRAECVRVATIVDDGKDLERLNVKIAQRPPMSLRDTIAPLHERKQATTSSGEEGAHRARRCKSHTSVLMFRIVNENQAGTGH